MTIQDCLIFATEHPVCFLATTDGEQPHVRTLLLWFANEYGWYFAILSNKAMSRQLKNNPHCEVCFYNNPPDLMQAKMMRVTGSVEFVNDPKLTQRAYEERKFLDDLAGQSIEPFLEIVRIASGEAHFWTIATDVLKEGTLERIHF